MADNWPASLPQKILAAGFTENIGSTSVSSNNSVGPRKTRQRTTARVDQLSGSMHLDEAQRTTLNLFYDTTLAGGSLPFTFLDPYTQLARDFIFLEPPGYGALTAGKLIVSLVWESVP